jgi:hypothetical protein
MVYEERIGEDTRRFGRAALDLRGRRVKFRRGNALGA